jgi:hypothetical protein
MRAEGLRQNLNGLGFAFAGQPKAAVPAWLVYGSYIIRQGQDELAIASGD